MRRKQIQDGFTLVEIAVVVMLIGILLAIAIPLFTLYLQDAQSARFVSDLRVYAGAFETYRSENGAWPADQPRDQLYPDGMDVYLDSTGWDCPTSIGGNYFFDSLRLHNGVPWPAVISVGDYSSGTPQPVRASTEQLADIDEAFDDGDLNTGRLQQGYQNMPILILDSSFEEYQRIAKAHEDAGTTPPSW
ncbi:MAG: type II secretion system protein [Opitutales bacterium]